MKYVVTTQSQVERIYHVEVDDDLPKAEQEKQGRKRVRQFIADPSIFAEGIVELQQGFTDKTQQRIMLAEPLRPLKPESIQDASTRAGGREL